jgi:hypothetical protein
MVAKPKKLRHHSPVIARLLGRVRRRIRKIVFGHGLAMSVAVLIAAFWIAFAFDYLPVKFGYSETPAWGRAILLLLSIVAVAWVFYKLILSRLFVRLKDTSMAMLVEKKYQEFNDSLLTTVGIFNADTSVDVPADEAMMAATKTKAESLVGGVDVRQVVRGDSLRSASWFSALLLSLTALLAVIQPSIASLAFKRLYLLDTQKWPRQTDLDFAGVTVKRDSVIESIPELNQVLIPTDGVITVAKGSSLAMNVVANETTLGGKRNLQLPETCWLNFQTFDGSGGSEPFKRIGAPRDGKQAYSFEGAPFENVIGDVNFDVLGGDDRIDRIKIKVVDRPGVEKTWLHLYFPEYMVEETSTAYVDQVENWTGQKTVPIGTKIKIEAKAKTELSKVYVRFVEAVDRNQSQEPEQPMQVISVSGDQFQYDLPEIEKDTTVEFFLCDTHGVVNEQPHVVTIGATKDQPPEIDCRLAGIGKAVTPDVQIPLKIKLDDDYGLGSVWLEIEIGDAVPLEEPLSIAAGKFESTIDFRKRREQLGEKFLLPVEGDQQLSLVVAASDRFNLGGADPNVGLGDRYDLNIVSPDELLRILEQAEVGQRRRLEQIIREVKELRDYAVRAKSTVGSQDSILNEPGDRVADADSEGADLAISDSNDDPQRDELRRLFAQRAILQNDKSRQEIMGCVESFEDLRLQLINNRVSADARQKRFEEQVIAPLRFTVESPMTELSTLLDQLEAKLREIERDQSDDNVDLAELRAESNQLALDSIEKTDQVLVNLTSVLNLLIKHETQNELLDIVRQMIEQQKALQDRTKKQRQKKAFEGLLD